MDPNDWSAYSSISSAALAAGPGDTILVVGLGDANGLPLPYSEQALTPHQVANGAESFPIQLKEGVVLKPTGSTPVYVWSILPGSITLIDVQEVVGASGMTRIESLRLGGATVGIRLDHQNHRTTTLIKDVKFSGLETAVSARAAGSDISVSIRDCQLRDDSITTSAIPPLNRPPTRGYHLQAAHGATAGHLLAEIQNHSSVGPFATMNPTAWPGLWDTPATASGTRVVEVEVHGGNGEYTGLPLSYATRRIPEVILDVDGGLFDGHASDGGAGWDTALYSWTQTGGSAPWNYYGGYHVTFSGAEIADFNISGLIGTVSVAARGQVELTGQTLVRDNAPNASPTGDSHNGVHLIAEEGYLAFLASNANVVGNAGNGIWLNCRGEVLAIPHYEPQGLYLGMDKVGVHGNGLSGVRAHVGGTHAGVVGGTSHYSDGPGSTLLRNLVDDGEGFQVPFGTGLMDSCKISNNGRSGVYATTEGQAAFGFDPNSPDSPAETVSFRMSNCAVWNNPAGATSGVGGLTIGLGGLEGQHKALCLVPLTHSTFVNNGLGTGSAGWSVGVLDPGVQGTYQWARAHESQVLRTALFNDILFRDYTDPNPSGEWEFNSDLEGLLGAYDQGGGVSANQIGMAGLRADTNLLLLAPGAEIWNVGAGTFAGPVSLTSYNANQFLLAAGYAMNFGTTPIYLNAFAPETALDYQDQQRPGVITGDRDKGFDQY